MSTTENYENRVILRLTEDLVAASAARIKSDILAAVGGADRDLDIDLSQVRIVDSLGIAVLIATHNTLSGKGHKLRVVDVPADVASLLHMMRLDRHFEVTAAGATGAKEP